MQFEFDRYPKYRAAYVRAFDKMLEARKDNGKPYHQWQTGEDVMQWWLTEGKTFKVDENQLSMFMDEIE